MYILADRVHTYSTQIVIPTSSFAHLQKKVGAHSDQGTWQSTELPESDFQMSFASPRSQFAHAQARCWVTAPPIMECFQPYVTRGLVTTPGSYAANWYLSQEVYRADCPQNKVSTRCGVFCATRE